MGPISENGLGQVNVKPTSAKTPAPKRTVLPAPPKPPKRISQTPAQAANAAVSKLLAPQYSQAASQSAHDQAVIKGFTQAIIQQLSGLPGQTQGAYDSAINAQSAMANAAADSLRNANPYGQDAQILKAIGAPDAQANQIGSNLANTFNGGAAVGQYVNGVSPMAALQAQKLAAMDYQRALPGIEGLRGQQGLQNELFNAAQARAKIAEQQPGLVQNWLQNFQSNKAKNQQLALEAQAAGLKQQNTKFSQGLSLAKLKQAQDKYINDYNLRVKEFNAKQTAAQAKAALPNTSLSRARGFLVDSKGNAILDSNGKKQILPGYKTTAKGQVVKVGKAASTKVKPTPAFPNLTKSQVQHLRAGIANAYYGTVDKNNVKHPPLSYNEAVQRAMQAGYSRKDAVKMANTFYKMNSENARARKGKDATGLGIQTVAVP